MATCDVAELLLKDSVEIQEEEYERRMTGGGVASAPPMFTEKDVTEAMDKFSVSKWCVPVDADATDDITLTFHDAGHYWAQAS